MSAPRFYLNSRRKIVQFLEDSSIDIEPFKKRLEEAETALLASVAEESAAREAQEAALSAYDEGWRLVTAVEAELRRRLEESKDDVLLLMNSLLHKDPDDRVLFQSSNARGDLETRKAAWARFKDDVESMRAFEIAPVSRALMKGLLQQGADTLERVQAELSTSKSAKQKAQQALESAEMRIRNARPPEALTGISRSGLEWFAELDSESLEMEPEPGFNSDAEAAGYIRGELAFDCYCEEGYAIVCYEVEGCEIDIVLDDEPRHESCLGRQTFKPEQIAGAIAPKHSAHRMHSLKPWPASPISEENQRKMIAAVPSKLKDDLFGWMIVGPAGTSKTTLVAAAVHDWLTFRSLQVKGSYDSYDYDRHCPKSLCDRLNFWRVKVPQWTRETEAWENRDYGDSSVKEPDLTTPRLERATTETELRPILVLEELDKFHPTKNRIRFLYTLVDAVYEAGGCIVSTSNEPPEELEKLLGEPLYRRLSGKYDPPGQFLFWNLFKAEKPRAKSRK